MKKLYLISLCIILALTSCTEKTPRLVIVHTNDTHSHLEPLRCGEYAGYGGAVERAAFIDSIRDAYGEDKVLLLHAGDFNQGSSYYTELHGSVEVNVVNAMKYDCLTLGNHEFDNGIEDLTERVKKIECPIVCSNLDLSSFELGEYVKPYCILEKGGLKIGVIGLETDLGRVVSKPIVDSLIYLDPVETVNKWSEYLKNDECCDMVVLLSHRGFEQDKEIVAVSGNIDVVVGGHTHTFLDSMPVVKDRDSKNVPVVTDGCMGVRMGVLSVY